MIDVGWASGTGTVVDGGWDRNTAAVWSKGHQLDLHPQTPETQDADTGIPVWAVVGTVMVATALLALPSWWLVDSYILTGDQPVESDTSDTTTSANDEVDLVNLALRKTVTATGPGTDPSSRLVDGDPTTTWNSGGFPPQVVQIDLGESSTIHSIRLLTGQSPAGDTEHIIFGWPLGESEPDVLHQRFAVSG